MNILEQKKDIVKAKMVELVAKNCLSTGNDYSQEILLQAALLGWIEEEPNIESLIEKSKAFIELSEMLEIDLLFKKVKSINETKNNDDIQNAIRIYKILIENGKYKELATKSTYQIPLDFGIKENYLNSTLYEKVIFFQSFQNLLKENLEELKEEKKDGYKI